MNTAAHISKRFGDLEHLVDETAWSKTEVLHEIRALKTEVLMALGTVPPEEDRVEVGHMTLWGFPDGRRAPDAAVPCVPQLPEVLKLKF